MEEEHEQEKKEKEKERNRAKSETFDDDNESNQAHKVKTSPTSRVLPGEFLPTDEVLHLLRHPKDILKSIPDGVKKKVISFTTLTTKKSLLKK